VIDLGLEGKMLFAAFAAGAAGAVYGSTAVAVALAIGVATGLSWLHGLACVSYRGDQVVSGVATNIIAAGLTVVLGMAWFAQGGQTPAVSAAVRISPLMPDLADWVQGIAIIGPVLGPGLLGHDALVYLAFAMVPAVWWRSPAIIISSEDLPQPDGPTMTVNCPSATCSEISAKAGVAAPRA
jgi:simple sugar transport system permease protein